jgi:hypothetical protein
MPSLPEAIILGLAPFAPLFSRRVWCYAPRLLRDAMLAPRSGTAPLLRACCPGRPGRPLVLGGEGGCAAGSLDLAWGRPQVRKRSPKVGVTWGGCPPLPPKSGGEGCQGWGPGAASQPEDNSAAGAMGLMRVDMWSWHGGCLLPEYRG